MTTWKDEHISQYAVRGFDQNFSYVIWNHIEQSVAVVDPAGDMTKLLEDLKLSAYHLEFVLFTHSHTDHTEGLPDILSLATLTYVPKIIGHWDFQSQAIKALESFTPVRDEHKIHLGSQCIDVFSTPGHIRDAVCFYIEASVTPDGKGKILTGDTLFVEGCGRTTHEDAPLLFDSIRRLKELPEDTVVYPGHDYGSQQSSTIAYEKTHNRFLRVGNLEDFVRERFLM